MSKETIDDELAQRLINYLGAVELRDSKGKLCGHFLPYDVPLTPLQQGPDITRQELERRRAEGGYITTEELLRRLNQK